MARYDSNGGRVPTDLFEAAALEFNLRATCAWCRHTQVLNRYALWWRFEQRGWDMGLSAAAMRFRCLDCGRRLATLDPVRLEPTTHDLPVPDAFHWKKAVTRFRS